jgi:hypothetical protein
MTKFTTGHIKNDNLEKSILAFKIATKKNKKKVVEYSKKLFLEKRKNYKGEDFFNNLDNQSNLIYLWFLEVVKQGYYKPSEYDLDCFRK